MKNESTFHPLFKEALAGNQRAYAELLRTLAPLIKQYASKKSSGHSDCEDIAQEILISVHKALHTYDPARPCMPWLAAIMHYRMSDWLRSRYSAAEAKKVPLADVEDFLMADVTKDPREHEYVSEAVRRLPEKQQAVINAMYHEELSVRETSNKLQMGESAVKVTAHRAYKALRKKLEGQ